MINLWLYSPLTYFERVSFWSIVFLFPSGEERTVLLMLNVPDEFYA